MFSNFKYFALLLVLGVSIVESGLAPTTSLDEEDDHHFGETEEFDLSNNTDSTLEWEPTNENVGYTIKRVNLSAFVWPSSSPPPKAIDYGIDRTIRTVFKDKPDMWHYVAGLMSELMFPSTSPRSERSRYYPLPPEEVYSTIKIEEMKLSLRPEVEETSTPMVHPLEDPVLDVREHSEDSIPSGTQFRNFNSSHPPNKTSIDRAATLLDILRKLNLTYPDAVDDRSFEPGSLKELFDDSGNNFWNASWMNETVIAPKPRDSHIISNETGSGSWSRISILDPSVDLSNAHLTNSTEFEGLMELIDSLTENLKDSKFDLNSSRFEILNFAIPPEAESKLNYSTSVRFPRDGNESRSDNESIDVRSGDKLISSENSSKDGKVKFFEEVYDLQNVGFWFVKSDYKVNESTSNTEYETPGNWSVKGRSFSPINSSDLMNFTVRSHPSPFITTQFSEILQNMADKIANETKKIHQEIEVFLKENKDHIVVHTSNDNFAYNLTDRNSSNAKTNYDALTELELRMENEIKEVINSSIDDELNLQLSRSGRDSILNSFHHWLSGAFSDMCRVNYTNEECEKLLQSILADLQPLNSSLAPTSQPHFTTSTYGTSSTVNYILMKSLKETSENVNFTEPEKRNARFFNPQHLNFSGIHDEAMDEMEAVHTSPEFHQSSQIESPLKNDSNYLRQLAESYEGRNNTKDQYYLKGSHQSRSTNRTIEVHHLLNDLDHPNNGSNARMARNGEFTFIGNESVSKSNESLTRNGHEDHDFDETIDDENSSVKQTMKPTEEGRLQNKSESDTTASTAQTATGRIMEELNFNVSTAPPQFRIAMNDSRLHNATTGMQLMGRRDENYFRLNVTSQSAEFQTVMNESELHNDSLELMGRSKDGFNLNATSQPAEFRTGMNESELHNDSMELMGRSKEDGFNLNATSQPAEFRTGMNDSELLNATMELMGRNEDGFNNATSQPAEFRTAVNDSELLNATMELMGRSDENYFRLNVTSQPAEFRTVMNESELLNASMELMGRNENGFNLNATSQPAESRTAVNDSELLNATMELMGRSDENYFRLNLTSQPAEVRTAVNESELLNASRNMGRNEGKFNGTIVEPVEFGNSSFNNPSFEPSELSKAVNETISNFTISSEMGRDAANVSDLLMERSLQNKPTLMNSTKLDTTFANKTNVNDSKNFAVLESTGRNENEFNESMGTLEFRSAAQNDSDFTKLETEDVDGRDKPAVVDFLLNKIKNLVNGTHLLQTTRRRKMHTTPFSTTPDDHSHKTTSSWEVSPTTVYKTETMTEHYYHQNGNINKDYTSGDSSENYGPTEPASNYHHNTNFLPIFGTNNKKMSLNNYLHQSEAEKHSGKLNYSPFQSQLKFNAWNENFDHENTFHFYSSNFWNMLRVKSDQRYFSLEDLELKEPFQFPFTKICYRNEDCATELYEICIHALFTNNYCDCPSNMSRNKITNVCRIPLFNDYPYSAGYGTRYKRSGKDASVVQTR